MKTIPTFYRAGIDNIDSKTNYRESFLDTIPKLIIENRLS